MTEMLFDAVIVGYGPVGQMLAILLGQAGYRVAVFERYLNLYHLPRAVHFDDEIARILQAAGVMQEVTRIIDPAMHYEWRNAKGETLLFLDWSGMGPSGWLVSNMFYQPDFQAILHRRLQSISTVEVHRGWEAIATSQYPDHIELTVRHENGEQRVVHGSYLIGADGANSFVRQQMHTTMTDFGFVFDWLVVDVKPHEERTWEPPILQICDPARPTTLVSGGKGRRRWEFMLLPGESAEELNRAEMVWQLLAPWQLTPANTTLERHTIYTFRAMWADAWREGRFFLVGDAAHLMPPFAGQGMCAGMRDAINLAWKLDLVLSGRTSDSILDSYTSERVAHVRHFINYSVELGSIICITDPEVAAARDERMLAERQQAQSAPPEVPPTLGAGILRTGDPLAGQLFIQGEVLSDGQRGLFDDVVGHGFCLISTIGDPAEALSTELQNFLNSIQALVVKVDTDRTDSGARIIDINGTYAQWFTEHRCAAVLVRPDFYIFGTAKSLNEIPDLVADLQVQLAGVPITGGP